jgi:peptide/nickel transport system permease protein
MIGYILKRFLFMIPTLIGITFITFLIMKLAPGDPEMLKLRFVGQGVNPEALAAQLKSARPPIELPPGYVLFAERVSRFVSGEKGTPEQLHATKTYKVFKWSGENSLYYWMWLKNIAKLDFGLSFKDKRPVTVKIMEALPVTLLINVVTIIVIYLVSVPLGIWSAVHSGSTIDKIVMVKLFIFYSLPTFWIATMLLMFFAGGEYLDWFPIMGITSDYFHELNFFGKIADVSWHLFLPVLADTIGSFAFLMRFSRSNFLDVIKQDYVRTARAKGLPERTVLYKHGLRNAMIPFVTLMGSLLPGLLGGSVIIEQIFSIPGMGMLSFEAVLSRDHNVIMGIATISAFLTLVSLFLADVCYVIVDPRISLK